MDVVPAGLDAPPRSVFRPDLDLDGAGRVELARLLAETAARAGAGVPVPGARRPLALLAELAASAAGDGPVQVAAGDLTESQANALQAVLSASARRARGDLDPAAAALSELCRAWEKRIGWKPEPLPVGGEW